ncbi:MAG TPA: hypothetical protein VGO09_11925 [Flavisolibacter sp.]|nr:hypothetical protein [Flavisolibacter sp.]
MNITVPINIKVYRISIGVFFFVAGLTFSSWASRIPDIKNHLQLRDAGLGIVLFLFLSASLSACRFLPG